MYARRALSLRVDEERESRRQSTCSRMSVAYFKNSSLHTFSHFGAASIHLIGSIITYLCRSSSVCCVRLEGLRPMSARSFWPSGDRTKSASDSAAWGCKRIGVRVADLFQSTEFVVLDDDRVKNSGGT